MILKDVILYLLLFKVLETDALFSVFGYVQFKRDVPNEDSFLTSVSDVTLDGCISECGVRTSCHSVTYRRTSAYCRMYGTEENDTVISTGVLYSQRTWWTELQNMSPQFCNASCPESQTCGHVGGVTCHYTECPSPFTIDNSDMDGNLRNEGAKAHFICIDGAVSTGNDVSTCQSDSQWGPITLVCDMGGFRRSHVGFRATTTALVVSLYGEDVFYQTTRSECTSYCRNETNYCEAVSYFPENGTCVLNDRANGVEDDGWEIIVKIFPVLYYWGPDGRYTLTHEGAIERCQNLGTTIASSDDVVQAYNMGYNLAQCGWVLEGHSLIAVHHPVPGMIPTAGLSVCAWATKWNVFCRNPEYNY